MKKLLKKLLLLLFNKGYKKREAEERLEKESKILFKEINNWPLKEKKSKKEEKIIAALKRRKSLEYAYIAKLKKAKLKKLKSNNARKSK